MINYRSKNPVYTRNFGKQIPNYRGIAELHEKTGKPVWFVCLIRGRKGYRLHLSKLNSENPGSDILTQFRENWERLLSEYPEQYYFRSLIGFTNT